MPLAGRPLYPWTAVTAQGLAGGAAAPLCRVIVIPDICNICVTSPRRSKAFQFDNPGGYLHYMGVFCVR